MFDFLDGPVRSLVTQVYDAVGYVGVALWVAIESVIVPIPSEVILPFAGFLVGRGVDIEPLSGQPWNLWLVTLAGALGATGGALIAYAIGAVGGRPFLLRWGRMFGITTDDLDRTERFFARHGTKATLLGRVVPVVRSLVSFAAGIARMPILPFVVFTFLGSLPWTLLLVVAGTQLGANWAEVGGTIRQFEILILAMLAAIAIGWTWLRILGPRLRPEGENRSGGRSER